MSYYSPSIEKLIESFEKLPSIGHKTAVRLAFHMLDLSKEDTDEFINSIINAKAKLKYCSNCYNISDTDPCPICSSPKRDNSIICVVEDVKIKELLNRIGQNDIKEIIIATNPRVEGEATAIYLSKIIKPLGIKVTRIAHGIPVGGDLEYTDEATLSRALEGRREL